jgi:hypothetical protein
MLHLVPPRRKLHQWKLERLGETRPLGGRIQTCPVKEAVMASAQDPLVEKVESSFRKLSTVASELNFVSDELGKCVSEMDAALKKLNLGIEVWVEISGGQDDMGFWSRELGYQKIGGKWGIALRTISGAYGCEEDSDIEAWLFNDGPRYLRLASIEKIPELLQQLSAEGTKAAAEVSKRLTDVKKVAAAVKRSAEEPIKRIIARGELASAFEQQLANQGQEQKK